MHTRIRRVALAVTAVAIVAIGGGVTYAVADIGGGEVINGCYKSQNGQLRLVDPAADSCHPSETGDLVGARPGRKARRVTRAIRAILGRKDPRDRKD